MCRPSALACALLLAGAARASTSSELLTENLYFEAQAAQWRDDFARSLELLTEVERKAPDLRLTRFLLGFALQKLGKDEDAVKRYQAFLPTHPRYVQAHFNLGFALLQLGRCSEAIAAFERTLELKPDYWEVHLHLGTCFEKLGEKDEAQRHYAIWKRE